MGCLLPVGVRPAGRLPVESRLLPVEMLHVGFLLAVSLLAVSLKLAESLALASMPLVRLLSSVVALVYHLWHSMDVHLEPLVLENAPMLPRH